jgi:hypothetical protein
MWMRIGKHNEEHDDVVYMITQLTFALDNLSQSVKELREEVDYLADFLDD